MCPAALRGVFLRKLGKSTAKATLACKGVEMGYNALREGQIAANPLISQDVRRAVAKEG
jgi:hypothetical protein